MKKRAISILLILCVVLALLPGTVLVAEADVEDEMSALPVDKAEECSGTEEVQPDEVLPNEPYEAPESSPEAETVSDDVYLDQFISQCQRLKQFNDPANQGATLFETPGQADEATDYRTHRVIVKADGAVTDKTAIGVAGPYKGIYVFQYADESAAQYACKRFLTLPNVLFAEPSRLVSADAAPFGSQYTDMETWGYEEVGFRNIEAVVANKFGNAVNDVVIAVIDSGIDFQHPLFAGRLAGRGTDIVNNDDDPTDDNMHGTAVAGVIVGSTPAYVKVLPVKAGGSSGTLEDIDIYAGLEYAIAQGADIINMSFGGDGYSATVREAIKDADAAGILLVAAYGNDSKDTAEVYPASFPEVIAVSSVDSSQSLSTFSNYGKNVDVSAPGTQIYTAYPTYMGDNSGYSVLDGTSFSCPFTAAALAMIKASNPAMPAEEIRTILYSNTADLGEPGWDSRFGYGMISFNSYREAACEAQIGGIRYNTFQEAHYAAVNGQTIQLLTDIEITNTFAPGKNITVVGKDMTISRSPGFTGYMVQPTAGGSLTIGEVDEHGWNLTINGSASGIRTASTAYIPKDAELVFGNGVQLINGLTDSSGGAVYNEGTAVFYQVSFSGNSADFYGNGLYSADGSTIRISGQMSADMDDIFHLENDVRLEVDYPLDLDACVARLAFSSYQIGSIAAEYAVGCQPSGRHFKCAENGYRLAPSAYWLIMQQESAYDAEIGGTQYEHFFDAVSAAEDGAEISILRDIELNETCVVAQRLTISAQDECWITHGNTLDGSMFRVVGGASLTLDSRSGSARGLCVGGEAIFTGSSMIDVESGASLFLSRVYIAEHHGDETEGNSAIHIRENAAAAIDGAIITKNDTLSMGGAVYNEGFIDFSAGAITKNAAGLYGGGVANKGTFTMRNGDISNNEALYTGGGVANWETFTLENGTISHNTCTYIEMGSSPMGDFLAGGGIWNGGILTINGGQISYNCCHEKGGGIFNSSKIGDGTLADTLTRPYGTVYMNNGEISHNTAGYLQEFGGSSMYWGIGGGVFNRGEFYMDGGSVTENNGIHSGGGIYNFGLFSMSSGQIGDNSISLERSRYRSNLGEEIQSGDSFGSYPEYQNTVTRLTGGYIYPSNELSFADNMISVCGPNSKVEIGGTLRLADNGSIALSDAIIEVSSVLENVRTPIAVYPAGYGGNGRTIVTYSESVVPDASLFYDVNAYLIEVSGQDLVLTDKSLDVTASGRFYNTSSGNDLRWELSNHVLTISEKGSANARYAEGANAFFPHTPWQGYDASIHEIIVKPGCSSVGGYLFSDMHNLKRVILPYDLYSMDVNAFGNCTRLELVRFTGGKPDYISESVFEGCGDITVEYPAADATWDALIGKNLGARSIHWASYYQPVKSLKTDLHWEYVNEYAVPDRVFTLSVLVNGRSEHKTGDFVAVAAYGENGKMLQIDYLQPHFSSTEDETLTITYDNSNAKIKRLKSFWLSSESGYSPLAESLELESRYQE